MKNLLLLGFLLICIGVASYSFLQTQKATLKKTYTTSLSPTISPKDSCKALDVISPKPHTQITSPLSVSVVVTNENPSCHWSVFEAQAGSIKLVDEKGKTLAQGVLKTDQDWMKTTPVPYTSNLTFKKSADSTQAILIISEENPSGKPSSQTITIPVLLR